MSSTDEGDGKKKYPILNLDAYSPEEVADRVVKVGAKKVLLPNSTTFMLGVVAGGFISIGVLFKLTTLANPDISDSLGLVIAPLFYAMGYFMAFTAGTEIFTTNNLAVMSYASRKVTGWQLTVNWVTVLFANGLGALSIAVMVVLSGKIFAYDGELAVYTVQLSFDKISYSPLQMIFQGVLANILICSGAWIAMAGRSVTDISFALFLPVSAVSAMGFQHAAGNMSHMFISLMVLSDVDTPELSGDISLLTISQNLSLVAFGNVVGGGIFIGLIYYFIYLYNNWDE